MIKRGIVNEELRIDSHMLRENGSCPLMPEEVCSLIKYFTSLMYFLLELSLFLLFVPKIRLCWVILRHLSILEICIKMLLGQGLKKWNWFLDILFSITFILSNYAEDINFKNIIPQSTLKSVKYFSHSDFF